MRHPNWEDVRTVGSIQLLTKASYLSLLIVPILAAIWPHPESFVVSSMEPLFTAAAENEQQTPLEPVLGEMHAEHTRIYKLPAVYVWAFMAALMVVTGHFVYQLGAPQIVKTSSRLEYVDKQKADYLKQETSTLLDWDYPLRNDIGKKKIEEIARKHKKLAIGLLHKRKHKRSVGAQTDHTSDGEFRPLSSYQSRDLFNLLHTLHYYLNKTSELTPKTPEDSYETRDIIDVLKSIEDYLGNRGKDDLEVEPRQRRPVNTLQVELVAQIVYSDQASRNKIWIYTAIALYFIALAFVIAIITSQTISVWSAAFGS